MTRIIITIAAVLALGAVAFFVFFDNDGTPQDNNNRNGDGISSPAPEGWEWYTNPQFDFSFAYPAEGEARVEAGRIKITYLGPNNTMNSEITDGFTFYVDSVDSDGASLREVAEAEFENETEMLEPVSGVEQTTVGTRTAYTFAVESQLGPTVTHVFIEATDGDTVYHITHLISGDEDGEYAQIVNTMMTTLTAASADNVTTETVSIALLDLEYEGEPTRGCDQVVMVDREIPETTAPLTAAINELFSLNDTDVEGYFNFMANTNDTLSFDRAAIEDGTASIYLTGELSGLAGVCDDPRTQIQIEETALQFDTVNDVQIYLNGEPTDLQPDASGLSD